MQPHTANSLEKNQEIMSVNPEAGGPETAIGKRNRTVSAEIMPYRHGMALCRGMPSLG